MSESKHTPGSWRVEEGTTLVWGNCNPDDHTTRGMGYPIAEARITPSGNWSSGPYADEGEANARLIAAAPDLMEALQRLLDAYAKPDDILCCSGQDCGCMGATVRQLAEHGARAAISKAKGESK